MTRTGLYSLVLLSSTLVGCATMGTATRTETVNGADLTCPPSGSGMAGRLHISVVDGQGTPLSQARVTVRRLSSDVEYTIVADDTGHLNIEHLLPGSYSVDVVVGRSRGASEGAFPVRQGCTTSVTVRVGPG